MVGLEEGRFQYRVVHVNIIFENTPISGRPHLLLIPLVTEQSMVSMGTPPPTCLANKRTSEQY